MPTATAKPRTTQTTVTDLSPLERALQIAHGIRPDDLGLVAAAELARCTLLVTSLQGAAWRTSWVAEMKAALMLERQAAQRIRYLESLGREGGPVRIPSAPADVDAPLVVGYITIRGPIAVVELLGRAEAQAKDAEGRLSHHKHRVGEMTEALKAGSASVAGFIASITVELTEIDRLAKSAHSHRNAMSSLLARLAASAAAALGDPIDLKLGLAEATSLTRRQDTRLAAMTAELGQIQEDLARLGADGGPAGKIAGELDRRRVAVEDQIQDRKTELANINATSRGNLVEKAMAGEPSALSELHGGVVAWPQAFPDGLAGRIVTMMAESAASAADVLAELL